MKTGLFIALVTTAFVLSCTSKPPEPNASNEIPPSPPVVHTEKRCYAYDKDEDLIGLTITLNGDRFSGYLAYAHYLRDRTGGTVEGYIKGDTLIADYAFSSNGRRTIREVVFLNRNNVLLEGFGDVEVRDNKTVFKNRAALKFDETTPLSQTPCHK